MVNDMVIGHVISSNYMCFCVSCYNFLLSATLSSSYFQYFLFLKQSVIMIFCIIGIATTCSVFYLLREMVYGLLGDVLCNGYDVF